MMCIAVNATADDNSAWMSRVNDNIFVSQLSIPGAHDAGTGHGTSADNFARTQDINLTEQWNNGVRAFDLRPSVDNNKLRIYHGIISTDLYLSDALATLCGLLDSHPTEFAIVIMRHEDDHDDGDSNWNGLMKTLLTSDPVKSHAINYTPMAKMGDVRGKLLILCRNAYDTRPVGGFVTGWGFNSNFDNQKGGKIKGVDTEGPLYIQDFYDVSGSGAPATKTASIQRMLQFSCTENTNPNLWVINHTSGYSKTLFGAATRDGYRDNAATQNTAVVNYLNSQAGATGLILMDCAGVNQSGSYFVNGLALTNALINNNFKEGPHADYFRALTTITADSKYCITTTYNGTKYFLTTTGYLTDDEAKAGVFTFSRVTGDAYYYGFNLKDAYFTNPPNGGNPTLNNGHIATDATSHRTNWEAQVFFLNSDGKYAVRATNAAGGTSGWAVNAQTFWTVNSGTDGPIAEYSNSKKYIWNLETPSDSINVTYQVFFNNAQVGEVKNVCARNSKSELPETYRSDLCTYSYSPTKITAGTIKVTVRWKGPFAISTPETPQWYNLRISRLGRYVGWENREPYRPHAFDTESAEADKDPESDHAVNIESELYATDLVRASDAYQWAFFGDPFNGIKIVNRLMGDNYALTIDGEAVTAYSIHNDHADKAPNAVLRTGDSYAYGWIANKNTSNDHADGFVLNLIGTNKYINPHGSADGFFQIWESAEAKTDENTQLRVDAVPNPEVSLTLVGDEYFTTLCLPYEVTIDGAEVFTLADDNIADGRARFAVASSTVAAGTPVLLKGTEPTATLTYGEGFTTRPQAATALMGLFMPDKPDGALTLQVFDDVVGFYTFNGDFIPANQIYLKSDTDISTIALSFGDEDYIRISKNNIQNSKTEIYNLNGCRITTTQAKGVYIIQGKKMLIQ